MTFLPIVARELRVASRRRATYFVRMLGALATMFVGTWIFLMFRWQPPQAVATALFMMLSGAAGFYSLLSGVRATSDCLSREKREGTLGLLFLTDLKGYDVILGKLLANSVNVFYGVLAMVPMLGIPLLLGGITAGEFGRMSLVAINTLFWSLSIGICVSALSTSARKASGATFLVIVLLTGFMPALSAWLEYKNILRGTARYLLLVSPGFSFTEAMASSYRLGARPFWTSIGVIHATGWLCLMLAGLVARTAWHDRPAGARGLRWRERILAWSYGNAGQRAAFRRRLLDANAFFWLAARARLGPALVWGVLGLLGCFWIWGALKWPNDWYNEGIYVTTGITLNMLIKGWFTSEVSRQLAEERQNGTMELLLSTPLGVKEILAGLRMALQRQFLAPTVLVVVTFFVLMVATRRVTVPQNERAAWAVFWLCGIVMFLVDLVALYWVGIWQAITSRTPHTAATNSVARVLVLPWLMFLMILLFMALSSMSGSRGGPEPGPQTFIWLWFVLGLLTDIGFGIYSREKVMTEFREVASQRYGARGGLWDVLFRGDQAGSGKSPQPRA